jgi:hypothetical protein
MDGLGHLYVAGAFTETSTFGINALVSAGDSDMFVAKLAYGIAPPPDGVEHE